MRIGIDVSPIIYGTGVSNYTKYLVSSLLEIDKENKYILFGSSLRRYDELKRRSNAFPDAEHRLYHIPPTALDIFWNRFHILPIELLVGQTDIFHASDWTQPPSQRAKLITTIHDLSPLVLWKMTNPKIVAAHRQRLYWVRREIDKVIAVSQATKKDIMHYLGIPEEKIKVIYEAPDPVFIPVGKEQIGEIKRRLGINGDYLLAIGTQPRKNIHRIARAMEKIKGCPQLVVAGQKWEDFESHNKVKYLGYVNDKDLPALYNGARALVYASLYEGFGLPILEAMACGCPVVTSNISSMPEVAGDAAVLVHPEEITEITKGIEIALFEREKLVRKGFERVKKFSWKKVAQETLGVYKEVVNT